MFGAGLHGIEYDFGMDERQELDVAGAVRWAVSRIRAWGIDGPRPIEEIEALLQHGDTVAPALSSALDAAGGDELTATIHLVTLLRCEEALDAVQRAAFERPAPIEAKREAAEAFRAYDREPPPDDAQRLATLERFLGAAEPELLQQVIAWPEAWRAPAMEAWLATADTEQVELVVGLLGADAMLDSSLIDWLGGQATAEAGAALHGYLSSTTDRQQTKRIKKALHRMRSKGFAVEAPASAESGEGGFSMALEGASLDGSRAFVTSVDGRGARLVWILARAASGGTRLLQAVVDDTTGIREAEIASVTRKSFRDYLDRLKESPTLLVEQTAVDRALALLEAAANRTRSHGEEPPEDYSRWLELVGNPVANGPERPDIYDRVAEDEVGGDSALIDASVTLLREPHFSSWGIEDETAVRAAEQVRSAETSMVMISDDQRRERMEDAIRDAVRESFDDEARQRYRGRLETMADMLWNRGEEEAARQAVAAAIGFTQVDDLFHGHAFARALVHRGVWLAYQDRRRREGEQPGSRLIRP